MEFIQFLSGHGGIEKGKIFYYENVKQPVEDADFSDIISSIDSKFEELDQIENEINEQKKTQFCPNCGVKNSDAAVYCNNCGEKL